MIPGSMSKGFLHSLNWFFKQRYKADGSEGDLGEDRVREQSCVRLIYTYNMRMYVYIYTRMHAHIYIYIYISINELTS